MLEYDLYDADIACCHRFRMHSASLELKVLQTELPH